MKNSLIGKDLAELRLKKVESLINEKSIYETTRSSHWRKSDLIEERLQLKSFLGHFDAPRVPIGAPVPFNNNSHLAKDCIMKIEFEPENKLILTFNMVKDGQLFVSMANKLFQNSREEENEAWLIADSDGNPCGETNYFSDDTQIKRILPLIRHIAF